MTKGEKQLRSRASFFESAEDEREVVKVLDNLRSEIAHMERRNERQSKADKQFYDPKLKAQAYEIRRLLARVAELEAK